MSPATERCTNSGYIRAVHADVRSRTPIIRGGRLLDDGAYFDAVSHLVAGVRGRLVYEQGDTEAGIWSVGMAQGLIDDIPTGEVLVERIVREAADVLSRLQPTGATV